jgi:hypothetical protein
MKKLSTSDPQSLDSGILTRSSSISDISDSQTDIVTSNEFDTDNETVDVADSDDGESDTEDSETYADGGQNSDPGREEEGEGGSSSRLSGGSEASAAASSFPQHEAFLRYQNRRQKKDFVSELYHTAVAKVPKVIPSDSESLYSSQSTMRRDFEYDSLDINSNCRYKDIYTNPNMAAKRTRAGDSESLAGGKAAYRNPPTNHNSTDRDDYEIVNVKSKEAAAAVSTSGGSRENVAEMYVNKEYDASTLGSSAEEEEEEEPGYEYSAGEKMMISISGDNESVYSNKLLISVNGGGQGAAQPRAAHGSPSSRNFDPDTLERGNASAAVSAGNKKGEQQQQQLRQLSSAASEFLPSSQSARFSQPGSAAANRGQNKSSFYLFREEDQVGHRFPAAAARGLDSTTAVVVNSKPSLPPKTRLTPKLPPKPIQKGRPVPRPLPPPPPPAPNLA